MKTIKLSSSPMRAPDNFRELAPRVVIKDGDGLWETSHGSGVPCSIPCDACGNTERNLLIYDNWGHSYPNGNSWSDREILCGACGMFALLSKFTEG